MIFPDSAKISDAVLAAVQEVSERVIMPRYKSLAKSDVRTKSHPGDLVTIADEEAELELSRLLDGLIPGAGVIGEESASKNAGLLEQLMSDRPVWVIDPIDGTANFVHGHPRFAVIVALIRNCETLMGWIHDPVSGESLHAEKGGGAWLQGIDGLRKQRIPDLESEKLSKMVAALNHKDLSLLKGQFGRISRLGSAAHDYWSLAEGHMQVLCYRRMKPWDHAAGLLIHTEAGGFNRLMSGKPYKPCLTGQTGLLCAPNERIWEEAARLMKPVMRD